MKQRNHAFDLLCGICIIRMIMLHITQMCGVDQTAWWTGIMHWSFYFMSFFFFKAGYFNKSVSGKSWPYVVDKAKRLLVPWASWGFIGSVVYFGFCLLFLPPQNSYVKQITWNHIWESGMFYGNGPMWFLMSFFMAYVAIHFIEKVRYLHWILLVFPAISYWLFTLDNPCYLDLDNVFMGLFFFFLGHIWHKVLDRLSRLKGILLSCLLVAGFVWINLNYDVSYTMSSNKWVGDPWIVVTAVTLALCGLSGVLLLVRIPRIPVLCYIGEHSMVFFVAHWPILMFYIMTRSANVHTVRHHFDDYVFMIVMAFSICFWLVPYVEKVPLLSGRWKKH